MKRFALMCLIMTSTAVLAKVIPSETVEVKNNIFVDKSGAPVTGTIEHYFSNKKIFLQIEAEDGKQTQMTMYYPNGKKRMHDTGLVLSYYHANGILANEVFRSAEKIVLEKEYYPNGELAQEIPHQDGYVGGNVKLYDMDGELIEEREYTTISTPSEKGTAVDIVRHGTTKVYLPNKDIMSEVYDNGSLKEIGYHDKDGKELKIVKQKVGALPVDVWREVSSDINKACQLTKDEKFSGLMLLEDAQGLLQITCQDGQIDGWVRQLVQVRPWLLSHTPYDGGKKHGIRIEYDMNDMQISGLIPYKKGVIDGTMYSFVPTNRLNKEVPFKNGKPHGLIKTYAISNNQDSGNVVIMEEPMKDGKLNGIVKIYNKMGEVIAQNVFKDGVEVNAEKKTKKEEKNTSKAPDKKIKEGSNKKKNKKSQEPTTK
ncbi:MAG: hypothetical protein IKV03_05420 [Alphaproteobacteria bacterium]|nr:hypothetical protein [Alphaproteobacteria bacterium]